MIICDASALVALINRSDRNHQRCVDVLPYLSSPLITTWSCFTEAMYPLARYGEWTAQQELWNYFVDDQKSGFQAPPFSEAEGGFWS